MKMRPNLTILAALFYSFLLLGSVASIAEAHGQAKPDSKRKEPLGVVAGQPIYDDDLLPSVQGQVFELRLQEFKIKRKVLGSLASQNLVEPETKKKHIP